jgi:phage FluMu protein Com
MLNYQQAQKPSTQEKPLQPWRCNNCGQTLLYLWLMPGSILEIKCPRCKAMNVREKP